MTKKKKKPKNQVIKVAFPFMDIKLWQKFVVGLKKENRFTLSDDTSKFIDLLIEYAKQHKTKTLTNGTSLFRARINDDGSKPFLVENMGAPPTKVARHGRLNPRGIPYLYLASEKNTAISEVRPWVGCDLTIAEFKLSSDCQFINFSKKHFVNIPLYSKFEGHEFTWRELITWMFSAPFDPRDDTAYIPTQFLAERIKSAGFAGIIYDSALSSTGYNVTLFDTNNAKGVLTEIAKVTSVDIKANITAIK